MQSPGAPSSDDSASDSEVQVLDSSEPLVPSMAGSVVRGLDEEPVASTSGTKRPAEFEPRPSSSGVSSKRKHYYSEEYRNVWNLERLCQELGTREQCIQFAEKRQLIPAAKLCPQHRSPMTISNIGGAVGIFRYVLFWINYFRDNTRLGCTKGALGLLMSY